MTAAAAASACMSRDTDLAHPFMLHLPWVQVPLQDAFAGQLVETVHRWV